jgi:hypothetical protein
MIVNFFSKLSFSRIVYNVSENREIAFRENVLSFPIQYIHEANIVAKIVNKFWKKFKKINILLQPCCEICPSCKVLHFSFSTRNACECAEHYDLFTISVFKTAQ